VTVLSYYSYFLKMIISNGSGVIVLTDRQTDKQTNTQRHY